MWVEQWHTSCIVRERETFAKETTKTNTPTTIMEEIDHGVSTDDSLDLANR